MKGRNKSSCSRGRRAPKPNASLYPRTEEIWGRVLPGHSGAESTEDFEARVEQAWVYMKGAFFAAEEHARLYSCIREMLARAEDA
jgi:hypothetical protein